MTVPFTSTKVNNFERGMNCFYAMLIQTQNYTGNIRREVKGNLWNEGKEKRGRIQEYSDEVDSR